MSQQEFEQNDQEVMELVNKSAAPEAKAMAEEIAQKVERDTEPEMVQPDNDIDAEVLTEEMYRKWRRKKMFSSCAIVAACGLIAAAIVIVMARPELLVWFANGSILCCGIVAALQIERIVRYLRR